MNDVVFVTGSQKKAEYLSELIGMPIEHVKLELTEIQSLELQEVVSNKVREAYAQVHRPVIVEDVSLELITLGRLPGTFIRWFIEELSTEGMCRLLDGKDRSAIARCMYGYFDGAHEEFFEGELQGKISDVPSASVGFGGFDSIFIPNGYTVTRAELSKDDDTKTYLQLKPLEKVRDFLQSVKALDELSGEAQMT